MCAFFVHPFCRLETKLDFLLLFQKIVVDSISTLSKSFSDNQTNDENPGSGARDRAILLTIICPPFKLITPLPSGSESV